MFSLLEITLLFASVLMAGATFAHADDSANATPTEWDAHYRSAGNRPAASVGEAVREGPMGGVWQRSQLLGDPLGIRSFLGRYGISLNAQETSEVLGNVTGGSRTGFYYDGLTTMDLQLDTQRAFGLRGGLFNASALQVHGLNLSQRNLGPPLQTVSGIEADDGIRLWELWYQQAFDYRQVDIKVGAQSLDQEFMVSQYAGLFVNTMFGWPMLTSANLPGGGPAYPLASLGARLRVQPMGTPWTFLTGVYDDNPSGIAPGSSDDPQVLDNHGTNFRLKDKPLVFMEIQFSQPAAGQLEFPGEAPILPGTYKLGAWYDFGQFADKEYGTDGIPLGNTTGTPSSNGMPILHDGNFGIYGVIDQLVWRKNAESPEGIGVFFRGMGGPGDQNQISYSLNSGVTWRAPIQHREYDVAGLGMGYAKLTGRQIAYYQDAAYYSGVAAPIPNSETFLELTYQYQIVPWWQLQPDLQYIFNPGGGIANPSDPSGTVAISNEFVMGIRTNITL